MTDLRIVMLSPHSTVTGPVVKHTPVLIDALREAGCEVQTAPWGRHSDDESGLRRIWSRIRDVGELRTRIRQSDFDVLVIKTSHDRVALSRDLPLLLATRRSSPVIALQFHGGETGRLAEPGSRVFKAATWLLFRLADAVLVLSVEEKRAAASFHPGGSYRTVLNPYVQPPPEPDRAQADKAASPVPTVLFVGRLIPEKGPLETIEAFALVRAERACRLVVAGRGHALPELERRVDALGLGADVTFVGHVTGDALLALYRNADIYVLPTYWPEGFPTAITEAMSAGLPVVTTCLRGMADHLREGENALFVPPKAPRDLAAAIRRLLDDDGLRARMGQANRAKVQDFAPAVAARRYIDVLEEIASLKTPA